MLLIRSCIFWKQKEKLYNLYSNDAAIHNGGTSGKNSKTS